MKIENTEVYGFRVALRGMRNPMNSWEKGDSQFYASDYEYWHPNICVPECPVIGPKDLELCCKLIKGGSVHRKFLRQIMIITDLTLPRYIWQEMDTYKVATVRNSCSTMHKLGGSTIKEEDFQDGIVLPTVLEELNHLSKLYAETKDYELVRRMKKILPEGFLQKATYSMSYETGLSMVRWRKDHRLSEWSGTGGICEWLLSLPYMKIFFEALPPENKFSKGLKEKLLSRLTAEGFPINALTSRLCEQAIIQVMTEDLFVQLEKICNEGKTTIL